MDELVFIVQCVSLWFHDKLLEGKITRLLHSANNLNFNLKCFSSSANIKVHKGKLFEEVGEKSHAEM